MGSNWASFTQGLHPKHACSHLVWDLWPKLKQWGSIKAGDVRKCCLKVKSHTPGGWKGLVTAPCCRSAEVQEIADGGWERWKPLYQREGLPLGVWYLYGCRSWWCHHPSLCWNFVETLLNYFLLSYELSISSLFYFLIIFFFTNCTKYSHS